MKTISFHCLAAALLLATGTEEMPGSVTIMGVRHDLEESHVFGGENLRLALVVNGPANATAKLTAQLYQAAAELVAPLGAPLVVGEVAFDGNGAGMLKAELPIPAVTKQTDLLVRFTAQSGSDSVQAGAMRVYAYPKDLSEPLGILASQISRTGRVLGVFGESEALRLFLRSNGIWFKDLGASLPPEVESDIFYLGEAGPKALTEWLPQSSSTKPVLVIVFTQEVSLLPGVYEGTAGSISYGKVTLPALKDLADDPRSQASLLAVLSQFLSKQSPIHSAAR